MIGQKIMLHKIKYILLWLVLTTGGHIIFAQQPDPVQWLTFEQLDDSLKVNPKKVFVVFYAKWCASCHKMAKVGFQYPAVATILNNDYYAVRMNIETSEYLKNK